MGSQSKRYCYNPTLSWNPKVEEYFVKAYGDDHFARISNALTRPSCYSCIRVNTLKSTCDAVIKKLLKVLQSTGLESYSCNMQRSKPDCSNPQSCQDFNTSILCFSEVMASLKATLQAGPIYKCLLPGLDHIIFVKGSGPHNIEYNFQEEKPMKEIIVSRKCAEAVLRGAQVYVPGVLACSAHVEKGDLVGISVAVEQPILDSRWGIGITRGTVLQGLQSDPYYIERNGLYIGQGTTMMSRAGIFRVLSGVAVDMIDRVFKLPSFHAMLEGEIFLQNLPSIITAHVLDPQPGERVLDMCASPGGKTTAIALLMKDKGEIVAADRSHNKVLDIQKLAAEMGLNCITTYKLNALKAVRQGSESENVKIGDCSKNDGSVFNGKSLRNYSQMESLSSLATDVSTCIENVIRNHEEDENYMAHFKNNISRTRNGPGKNHCLGGRVKTYDGFSPNTFDRVLLDAPCSALGLRPRLFAGEESVESLRNHAKYQKRMFDQAAQLVRSGGVIVYSTCTINPGENEALVRYALDTYKFLSLANQHPKIGGPGLVGHCEMSDGYVEEWLRPGEEDLVQRFDPSSPLDTIGFFIAKFNVGPKNAQLSQNN